MRIRSNNNTQKYAFINASIFFKCRKKRVDHSVIKNDKHYKKLTYRNLLENKIRTD